MSRIELSIGEGGLIARVGARVRAARVQAGLSQRALSERSGLSLRYVAQVEAGVGNISIGRLEGLAGALGLPVAALVAEGGIEAQDAARLAALWSAADPATRARALAVLDPQRARARKARRICLMGLRGAGKSTLGALVAADLGLPFVELREEIEREAGMPVAEIIALYGAEGYRELEAAALAGIVSARAGVMLAAAGGIVEHDAAMGALLTRFHTVWLRAAPSEHMERVRAQGDLRPMQGNPRAMVQLRQILRGREAQYAQADLRLDTANRTTEQSRADLRALIAEAGILTRD